MNSKLKSIYLGQAIGDTPGYILFSDKDPKKKSDFILI